MADNLTVEERERGTQLAPRFDQNGLISCVVLDVDSAMVLVVAFMNAEALDLTLSSGKVHFWSRSRKRLWMKGETSGHVLELRDVLIDCDQDALVVYAKPQGPTCHTGERSCFYRRVERGEGGDHRLVAISV